MRKKLNICISCILLILTLPSCEKGGAFDCFKRTGEIVMEDRYAEEFNSIYLNNNVDLYITQSDHYAISVEAGKNLQGGIKTQIENKVLTIKNDNRCNWTRSYDKPMNVYVSVENLSYISYEGSGNVYSTNTIVCDTIHVDIQNGGGSIKLDLNCWKSKVYNHTGTVDITISGYSDVNYMYNNSYGPIDCLNLETAHTYMTTRSSNDCYINVNITLEAAIENAGNIYYKGNPQIISDITGTGKLIKVD
jgi:hypothetical protein